MHILRCLQFFTAAIRVLICYPSSHIWLEPENLTVLTKKCFKKPNGWCKKVFVRIFIRPESFLYLELCVELLNSDVETYNYEIHFYSLNKKQDGGKRHRHGHVKTTKTLARHPGLTFSGILQTASHLSHSLPLFYTTNGKEKKSYHIAECSCYHSILSTLSDLHFVSFVQNWNFNVNIVKILSFVNSKPYHE